MADPTTNPAPPTHWLRRPKIVRRLWWALYAILGVTVIAEFGIDHHGAFGFDGSVGFNAWYGFITCVAMVLGAKLLGAAIKRGADYYRRDADSAPASNDD